MSTAISTKHNSNDLINVMIKMKPKLKNSIEQMETESLNTMDYYKEDSSNKNSLIDEANLSNKLIYNPNKNKPKERNNKNTSKINRASFTINKSYRNIHKSSNLIKTIKDKDLHKKIKNVPIYSNKIKTCNKCNEKLEANSKNCLNCKKIFCKNCFKGSNRNLDNNSDDNENYEQNFNVENICHSCKTNFNSNKNNNTMKNTRNKFYIKNKFEPLDTYCENDMENFGICRFKTIANDFNKEKIKNLEEQYKEYENFLNQIEERKKEIEIKRDISLNILAMIKKAIDYEFERNMKKLNEFQMKLNKIKNDIKEKINKNYQNEIELQINIDISKNTLKNFIKNFEKYNQIVISRPLFRGYKSFESNNILINYSESYYMKNKEILSDLPFGNVYIKIDRYTNNYVNYLNFSILIKQNDKTPSDDTINSSFQSFVNNKSRFVVNMIVNNKVIRLIKTNKDNNDTTLSYESSEEENKILFCKDKLNNTGGIIKKNNFNIKVIITEVML